MLRADHPPAGPLDADERNHALVTSDDGVLGRHLARSREQSRRAWSDTMRGMVSGTWAAAGFVAVFLLVRCFDPDLTFRQDLIVAAAATGVSAGRLLMAFLSRDRLRLGG